MKKKPIGKLVDQVATKLQLLVRLKASDDHGFCKCVSCGQIKHYKDMQGGHFIPRGCSETKLLEENIHPQCSGCNGFGMRFGSAAQSYTLYMQEMYSKEFVEDLIQKQRAKSSHKWVRADLDQLLLDIKEQIRFHENRIS